MVGREARHRGVQQEADVKLPQHSVRSTSYSRPLIELGLHVPNRPSYCTRMVEYCSDGMDRYDARAAATERNMAGHRDEHRDIRGCPSQDP
jgi:hypothetical protein